MPADPARARDGDDAERIRDRQVIEVLQELRVAITGAQILFAFLLTVPFSARWSDTTSFQRTLFAVTLLAVAGATGCFIAPTAVHRLRFHQRDRTFLVAYANANAVAGLCCLAVGIVSAMLLVTDFVFSRTTAFLATGALAALVLGLWFLVPLVRYATQR